VKCENRVSNHEKILGGGSCVLVACSGLKRLLGPIESRAGKMGPKDIKHVGIYGAGKFCPGPPIPCGTLWEFITPTDGFPLHLINGIFAGESVLNMCSLISPLITDMQP
jgi:hypothetical protein